MSKSVSNLKLYRQFLASAIKSSVSLTSIAVLSLIKFQVCSRSRFRATILPRDKIPILPIPARLSWLICWDNGRQRSPHPARRLTSFVSELKLFLLKLRKTSLLYGESFIFSDMASHCWEWKRLSFNTGGGRICCLHVLWSSDFSYLARAEFITIIAHILT